VRRKFGAKFSIPVVYSSQMLSVAFGKNAKQAGLDGQVIKAPQLEKIAGK
jgi:heterodisulfide reductase subunit B